MNHIINHRWFVLGGLATFLLWAGSDALSAATHTWKGTVGGLWSDPSNWVEGAPQSGESAPVNLIIPSSVPGFQNLTNDVLDLSVRELVIAAHASTLHALPGVVLRLEDGTLAGLGVSTILESSFRIEVDGTNHLQGGADFIVRGPFTENQPGAALHLSGNVRVENAFSHSGPTYLTNGAFSFYGPVTNSSYVEVAAHAELTLAADFTVLTNLGRLRVLPESYQRPETSRLFGKGLVCAPGSVTMVAMIDYPALDSDDPADGGRLHSRLVLDGPVVLDGRLEAVTDLFQEGLRFGIIENVGGVPTMGQFEGLPEGALMRVDYADLLTQRISYQGGAGNDVTACFVLPPAGRRLLGPFLLANGWMQILSGIGEWEDARIHRWEVNDDLANPNGWTAFGSDFVPADHGTLLTITNAEASPRRFFRLAVP